MRWKQLVVGVSSGLTFSGCVFSNQIISVPSEGSLQDVSNAIRHTSCIVGIRNGPRIEADSGYCMNDSIAVWDREDGAQVTYPLQSVWKVSTRDVGRGALLGLGTGILTGAAIGLLLVSGPDGGGSGMFELTDQGRVLVGTSVGILGGLVGATIGGLRGGLTEYMFEEEATPHADDQSPGKAAAATRGDPGAAPTATPVGTP